MSELEWLVALSGGDSRSAVDAATGRSKYLVPLGAADGLVSFASSTASPLTSHSLNVARAADGAWRGGEEAARHVIERLRAELHLDPSVTILLCASGTDAQATALEAVGAAAVAMACSDETGSGAALAVAGLRFDGALSGTLAEGRTAPRETRLIKRGEQWGTGPEGEWLLAMDCSKLASRSSLPLHCSRVMVDACQMRLSRTRLAALLTRGIGVVGTLSKFFCAPAFCGFVLLPVPLQSLASLPVASLERGLWLRFAVGLDCLAAYHAVPTVRRTQLMAMFVAAAREQLQRSTSCRLLESTNEEVEEWPGDNEEFGICSIVAFRVLRSGVPLNVAEAAALHRQLAVDHSVLLGQPVALRDGSAALRVSCDARWIVRLASSDAPEALLSEALECVDSIV